MAVSSVVPTLTNLSLRTLSEPDERGNFREIPPQVVQALQWKKENNIESIIDQILQSDNVVLLETLIDHRLFNKGYLIPQLLEATCPSIVRMLLQKRDYLPAGTVWEMFNKAIAGGQWEVLIELIQHYQTDDIPAILLGRALIFANREGRLDVVQALLQSNPFRDNPPRDFGPRFYNAIGITLLEAVQGRHRGTASAIMASNRFNDIPAIYLTQSLSEASRTGQLGLVLQLAFRGRNTFTRDEIITAIREAPPISGTTLALSAVLITGALTAYLGYRYLDLEKN